MKAKHAADAFTGESASLTGGRWNSPGSPMVYTAGSTALAAVEMLVHLGRPALLPAYVLFSCELDEGLVRRLAQSRLPPDWRSYPPPIAVQHLGDEWLDGLSSAALEVPSAIIVNESNFLLNPRHPDFSAIRISLPKPFDFDARLRRI